MKRLLTILAVSFVLAPVLFAAPRARFEVTRTSRNDGDAVTPFSIACTSTTWTEVVPASALRRKATVQTLRSLSFDVCIASITNSAYGCSGTTPGYQLNAGASVDHYGEVALNCRQVTNSNATASSETVKGFIYYDSAD